MSSVLRSHLLELVRQPLPLLVQPVDLGLPALGQVEQVVALGGQAVALALQGRVLSGKGILEGGGRENS